MTEIRVMKETEANQVRKLGKKHLSGLKGFLFQNQKIVMLLLKMMRLSGLYYTNF